MFSSKSKDTAPAPAPAMAPTAAAPKRARQLSAPSIISADMVINGTLASTGDIQIDGRVEGDVRSVVGRIRARKVLLAATSHVEGDILHEAFAVESGAFFEGNCRHSDNPLGDVQRQPPVTTGYTPAQDNNTPAALFAPLLPAAS
jgi:cytoskeletal protein CcmA (bactofilin family)